MKKLVMFNTEDDLKVFNELKKQGLIEKSQHFSNFIFYRSFNTVWIFFRISIYTEQALFEIEMV